MDPIDNDVNDVNPSILNVDTKLNISFPIFNDCNKFKFDNWNDVEFVNDPSPIDNVVNEGKSTMLVKYNESILYSEYSMMMNRNCMNLNLVDRFESIVIEVNSIIQIRHHNH